MRIAIIAGTLFLAVSPALAGTPRVPAVTAARILAVASADADALSKGSAVRASDGNAARLAALRSAMDGMAVVEPEDILALRAAVRGGARPGRDVVAALRRLDAVEATAQSRVLAAVTGPNPVRLDAEPDDLPAPVTEASR